MNYYLSLSNNISFALSYSLFHFLLPLRPIEEECEGWMEMFGRVLSQSAKYLPTQMSDVLTQQRCFAVVHLPFVDQITVCSIAR